MEPALFRFAQFEFPWALGPADGRYLVRSDAAADPERVVVLATLGGERRHLLRGRRARRAAAPATGSGGDAAPAPVTVTRATVIDAAPMDGAAARAWLAGADEDGEAAAALAVLDRVIYAQRIATADPYVHELSSQQALAVRVGWGDGDQVADGRWREARELPATSGRRRRRSAALRPQERLALLLGARNQPLLGEELALRARLDVDQHRLRHAALELQNAYATLLPALAADGRADLAERLRELEGLADGVAAAGRAALGAGVAPAAGAIDEAAVTHALERLEAALRARAAAGFAAPSP